MTKDTKKVPRPFIESIAGFSAGVSSTCVSHPLDVIKTRLQIQGRDKAPAAGDSFRVAKDVFHNEGLVKGFYRGLTPNVVGNSVSWALYFVCYDKIKHVIRDYRGPSGGLSYYDYFLASGTAGIFTSVCTNPIWVVKTRMLSTSSRHPGAYSSMLNGAKQIRQSEGFPGFYRGLIPSLFGVTHGALQFMAYEQLKNHQAQRISGRREDLRTWDYFLFSSLSKVFAGTVTYPYQVIRARLQMYDAGLLYRNARDVIAQTWQKEGLAGFYKGLGPNMIRVLPSTWVTFLVYEKSKQYLPTAIDKATTTLR